MTTLALILAQKLSVFLLNALSLHFLQLYYTYSTSKKDVKETMYNFLHQHMLEKYISSYSYFLHPTSESWQREK